jgi:hypothetical protein
VGKPERKRPLGRTRCRWMGNIEVDLREIGGGWYGFNSSCSGQEPMESFYEHGNEPSGSLNIGNFI